MRCPACSNIDSRVIRTEKYDSSFERIRKCQTCKHIFSTAETIAGNLLRGADYVDKQGKLKGRGGA
jgi:transcriptional regulator NrdR family protein